MLYIITEDSNSARDFWGIVAEIYKGKDNFQFVPLNNYNAGNTTLDAQVNYAFQNIQAGDALFVVFDNIGNTKSFHPADFIKKTASRCDKAG